MPRQARFVSGLVDELKRMGEPEPTAIGALLETIAAGGGDDARADYLILCLQELKGWADWAIAKLQKATD